MSKSVASCKNGLDAASPGSVTIFSERKQALCEVLNSLGIFPGSNMKVVLAQIYKKQIIKEQ